MVNIRAGMCCRSSTKTSLVGVDASGSAPADRQCNGGASEAADCRDRTECISEDAADSREQIADVRDDDDESTNDVQRCHDRNHQVHNVGDTAEAADDDDQCEDCENDTCDVLRDTEDLQVVRCGQALGCDGRNQLEHQADSVDVAEDLTDSAETAQIVERTANPLACFVLLTVFNTEGDFDIFGRAADESDQPDPEDSTGAAECDRDRNTYDVGSTDGGSQSRASRTEGRDLAFFVLLEHLAECLRHGITEMAELYESETDRNVNAAADDQDQDRNTPEPVPECRNCIKNKHTITSLNHCVKKRIIPIQ